ncbi:MAG: hypothetical protein JHC93_06260 [Parachlamydiales bacterium]|nr:hypothetical protein [Parachlamydiales bacterium]
MTIPPILLEALPSLIDPVDFELMSEAVICDKGHSFSRHSIEQCITSNHQCPISRHALVSTQLVSNLAIRGVIDDLQKYHLIQNAKPLIDNDYCKLLCMLNNVHIEAKVKQPKAIKLLHSFEVQEVLSDHAPDQLNYYTFNKYAANSLFVYEAAHRLKLQDLADQCMQIWYHNFTSAIDNQVKRALGAISRNDSFFTVLQKLDKKLHKIASKLIVPKFEDYKNIISILEKGLPFYEEVYLRAFDNCPHDINNPIHAKDVRVLTDWSSSSSECTCVHQGLLILRYGTFIKELKLNHQSETFDHSDYLTFALNNTPNLTALDCTSLGKIILEDFKVQPPLLQKLTFCSSKIELIDIYNLNIFDSLNEVVNTYDDTLNINEDFVNCIKSWNDPQWKEFGEIINSTTQINCHNFENLSESLMIKGFEYPSRKSLKALAIFYEQIHKFKNIDESTLKQYQKLFIANCFDSLSTLPLAYWNRNNPATNWLFRFVIDIITDKDSSRSRYSLDLDFSKEMEVSFYNFAKKIMLEDSFPSVRSEKIYLISNWFDVLNMDFINELSQIFSDKLIELATSYIETNAHRISFYSEFDDLIKILCKTQIDLSSRMLNEQSLDKFLQYIDTIKNLVPLADKRIYHLILEQTIKLIILFKSPKIVFREKTLIVALELINILKVSLKKDYINSYNVKILKIDNLLMGNTKKYKESIFNEDIHSQVKDKFMDQILSNKEIDSTLSFLNKLQKLFYDCLHLENSYKIKQELAYLGGGNYFHVLNNSWFEFDAKNEVETKARIILKSLPSKKIN